MGRPGQPPGIAEYTGEPRRARVKLDLTLFAPRIYRVIEDLSPKEAAHERSDDRICWLDIDGIHDAERVKAVGTQFGMHPLSVEDILDPEGRAKVEQYPDYLYLVARMVTRDSVGQDDIETEQISLILGRDFVLTFQEHDGDVFDRVRKRLKNPGSEVRQRSA
ncbi:MAG: magnesium transporter, partial [Myxococcota bacterium]